MHYFRKPSNRVAELCTTHFESQSAPTRNKQKHKYMGFWIPRSIYM
jgi:hypothetical protein